MDTIIDLSWRAYPACIIALAGAWLALAGVQREFESRRRAWRDPQKPIALVAGFRLLLIGVPLIAIAAAWMWQITWLFWLAAIIAGEETLETSLVLHGLREGERLKAQQQARAARRAVPRPASAAT